MFQCWWENICCRSFSPSRTPEHHCLSALSLSVSLYACLQPDDVQMYLLRSIFCKKQQENKFIYDDTRENCPLSLLCWTFWSLCWSEIVDGLKTVHTNTTGQRGCMNDIVSIMVLLCMSSSPIPPLCNHCNIPGATQTTNVRKGWMNEPIMYKMIRTNCESFALYSPFFELINTDCDIERWCSCVSFCEADKWGVGHLCAAGRATKWADYFKWSYL